MLQVACPGTVEMRLGYKRHQARIFMKELYRQTGQQNVWQQQVNKATDGIHERNGGMALWALHRVPKGLGTQKSCGHGPRGRERMKRSSKSGGSKPAGTRRSMGIGGRAAGHRSTDKTSRAACAPSAGRLMNWVYAFGDACGVMPAMLLGCSSGKELLFAHRKAEQRRQHQQLSRSRASGLPHRWPRCGYCP